MKTFETEKNNIPEGATHYSEECAGKYFCWYAVTEDDAKICVLDGKGFGYKWYRCTNEHYGCDVKPIPKPEVVEWKNGDECAYFHDVNHLYAYVGKHPHGDGHYIFSEEKGITYVANGFLRKPESPEEKEQREKEEAAWELYKFSCSLISEFDRPISATNWKELSQEVKKYWLAMVDKTNYRKGE